jgi:hypothetical protein
MKNFEQYIKTINEEAAADASISGMGPVISAQPGSVPGAAYTGDGTIGSGDIAIPLFKPANNNSILTYTAFKKNRFKRKRKKK